MRRASRGNQLDDQSEASGSGQLDQSGADPSRSRSRSPHDSARGSRHAVAKDSTNQTAPKTNSKEDEKVLG